jgi:hypothetical protein
MVDRGGAKAQTHSEPSYSALSLRDLLDAREQYHVHLMRHPNVVATALGYYRIRHGDAWPGDKRKRHGEGARTLENSEIRPYSWPAILVFVSQWAEAGKFGRGGDYDADQMVPTTLYLRDGRKIPVCVIEAPRDPVSLPAPADIRYPLNNIGSGHPLLMTVQNRQHVATVACLVTDGHKAYALTNRHVTGEAGEVVASRLAGRERPVGVSAPLSATRAPFAEVYPGFAGDGVFVNLDAGLVDVADLNQWTTRLKDGSLMGPMVDISSTDFPLTLVGRCVKGWGAASQLMEGEVHGLFYRYKSRGGFEYVADFLIGPRPHDPKAPAATAPGFATAAGDSGTLWLLEPGPDDPPPPRGQPRPWRPLALQWGANRLYSALDAQPKSYALATCLSTVCERFDVDVVRDWNLDQADTWGAVGHFAIASRAAACLTAAVPKLKALMANNAQIIGHDDQTILTSDFKGMGAAAWVPMADVPDFYWKHGSQGFSRHAEGPNHFADMDQKRPTDGKTLLDLCKTPSNIDPAVWNAFYDSVKDLSTQQPITLQHRGLLPFRVWQIFNQMVKFAGPGGSIPKFVCAAGVLAHYVGDACQPLHISYLHDGDPLTGHSHTVHHRDGTTSDVLVSNGAGVHSAYEDGMVNSHRQAILDALGQTPKVNPAKYVTSGKGAAVAVVGLMRDTFTKIPPAKIVATYVALTDKSKSNDVMWSAYGTGTRKVMQAGVNLLALLWESAWVLGQAEQRNIDTSALTQPQAMKICQDAAFVPSCTIKDVGAFL